MSKHSAWIGVAMAGMMAVSARSVVAADQPRLPMSQPRTQDDSLVCYMQTVDGRTLNLNGICGRNANDGNTNSTVSLTSTPAPNLGGLSVSRSADGSACYALDAQGRPCPPIQ